MRSLLIFISLFTLFIISDGLAAQRKTSRKPEMEIFSKEHELESGVKVPLIFMKIHNPPKTQLYFACGNLVSEQQPFPVKISRDGFITDGDDNQVMQVHFNALPGEPFTYMLKDRKGNTLVSKCFVPFPIKVVNKEGLSIFTSLDDVNFTVFKVEANGFKPNERVIFESVSGNEVMKNSTTADNQGRIRVIEMPAVIGKTGGSYRIAFTGSKGTVALEIPWGIEFLEWARNQTEFPSSIGLTEMDLYKSMR